MASVVNDAVKHAQAPRELDNQSTIFSYFFVLSLGVATSGGKRVVHSTLSSICKKLRRRCRNPADMRFLVGCSPLPPCNSPNTSRRFALGARNVCLMKTRCAPSRHCSDARVYGHTTTAMNNMSTPPPRATVTFVTLSNILLNS